MIPVLERNYKLYFADPALRIGEFVDDADCYLLTSYTPSRHVLYEVMKVVKEVNPRGRIVVGGFHAIYHPEDCLRHGADVVVVGAGESVVSHSGFLQLEGIVQVSEAPNYLPVMRSSFARKVLSTYFRIPAVVAKFSDGGTYRVHQTLLIQGCTSGCSFCHVPRCIRKRPLEDYIEEILFFQKLSPIHPVAVVDYTPNPTRYNIMAWKKLWEKGFSGKLRVYGKPSSLAGWLGDYLKKHPDCFCEVDTGLELIGAGAVKSLGKRGVTKEWNSLSWLVDLLEAGVAVKVNVIRHPALEDAFRRTVELLLPLLSTYSRLRVVVIPFVDLGNLNSPSCYSPDTPFDETGAYRWFLNRDGTLTPDNPSSIRSSSVRRNLLEKLVPFERIEEHPLMRRMRCESSCLSS